MSSRDAINEKLEQLQREMQALERERQRLEESERIEVIVKIRNLMSGFTRPITFEEIENAKAPKVSRKPKGQPKYGNGELTWTGIGKKPQWIVNALANGKKLEDYLL